MLSRRFRRGQKRRLRASFAAAALVVVTAVTLSGCASDPLAEQYRAGSGKNYIAGDGSVTEIAPENRSEPIEFSGTTLTGDKISSADLLGKPAVVNFWYAGCAPCRKEAPDLEAVFQSLTPDGVGFVGVNVRDSAATAATFNKSFGVTYPSVTDQDGLVQLAFASDVPPNAVPTTLVLDARGRVAARILGALADRSILASIIDTVLAEDTP